MNITDLEVVDLRDRWTVRGWTGVTGNFRDPYVQLTVDEPVNETGSPIYCSELPYEYDHYRIIPCGPFFAPEYREETASTKWVDLDEAWPEANYGELNKLDLLHGKQLFGVYVHTPEDSLSLAMEVPRLRRLLRKFRSTYELLVDEQAAIQGKLQWRLEESEAMCYGGALPSSAGPCSREPHTTVLWRNTHLPLCDQHLMDYQSMRKNRRVSHI